MKLIRSAVIACALVAIGAGTSQAQGRIWNVCGGSTFNTCASVMLNVRGSQVTVSVWNLSGFYGSSAATLFNAVGFENIGNIGIASTPSPTMTDPVRGNDHPAPWSISQDRSIEGIEVDLTGAATDIRGNRIASGCAAPSALPSWQ